MAASRAIYPRARVRCRGETLAARAIREGAATVSNDVPKDESLILGKMHAQSGVRSLAVFRGCLGTNPIGVLALYTSKPDIL